MNQSPAHANTSELDSRKRLWELIKDIRFGMLTTQHHNGHLHARPMTTQNKDLDEDATLWMFTSRSGEALADLIAEPSVAMVYADPGSDRYVCVSGTARLTEDRAKTTQLWSPLAKAWFPGGADDPDLALVRLDITHADYWDVKSNKLVQLVRMATAAVTGKPPKDMGEHGRVDMAMTHDGSR
jgi:general stress protein 26